MASLLRSIGRLYEAFDDHLGVDLDELLLSGKTPSDTQLTGAFRYAERNGAMRHAGAITPGPDGGQRTSILPPRSVNRLSSTWRRFLTWSLVPSHYRPTEASDYTTDAVDARRIEGERIFTFFTSGNGKPIAEPESGRVDDLTPVELEAIEAILCPDEEGRFPEGYFSEGTRFRNWMLYMTPRYGGFRIGETLKLCYSDIPHPSPADNTIPGHVRAFYSAIDRPAWMHDQFREDPDSVYDVINLERRPDDRWDDRRGRKPRVKTAERRPPVPDELLVKLREYIASPLPLGRNEPFITSPYLFVARGNDAVWRPISIASTARIIQKVGAYASDWMARNRPGVHHTLHRLHWHRLRHTRAVELLPDFLEDENVGLDEFCRFFGWSSILSARPYVNKLLKKTANAKVRAANRRIEEERALRRAARN